MAKHKPRWPVVVALIAGFQARAQPLANTPTFEVASIRAAAAPAGERAGMTVEGKRVVVRSSSLAAIICMAYRIQPYQLVGPDWISAQHWDILAVMPDHALKGEAPEMLRTLLAERFGLVVRSSFDERRVYALLVSKDGARMIEASGGVDPSDAGAMAPNQPTRAVTADGKRTVTVPETHSGQMTVSMGEGGLIRVEFSRMTMAMLAAKITPFFDRPVIDMTGLKGGYEVRLDMTLADMMSIARSTYGIPAGARDGYGSSYDAPLTQAAGIRSSIQRLGLRLESRRASIPVVSVEHVAKAPTEN